MLDRLEILPLQRDIVGKTHLSLFREKDKIYHIHMYKGFIALIENNVVQCWISAAYTQHGTNYLYILDNTIQKVYINIAVYEKFRIHSKASRECFCLGLYICRSIEHLSTFSSLSPKSRIDVLRNFPLLHGYINSPDRGKIAYFYTHLWHWF